MRAVALEKSTCYPRIDIDPEVIAFQLRDGVDLVEPRLADVVFREEGGRFFLALLDFHVGVWWDYAYYRTGEPEITTAEIKQAIEDLTARVERRVDELADLGPAMARACEKWAWLREALAGALEQELWQEVLRA